MYLYIFPNLLVELRQIMKIIKIIFSILKMVIYADLILNPFDNRLKSVSTLVQ